MQGHPIIEKSSGNVFEDLDIPHAEAALAKARLAKVINELIAQRGLRQVEAAQLLGIDQSKISALNRGQLKGFSTERLFRFLNVLGQNIQINILAASTNAQGSVSVIHPSEKPNPKKKTTPKAHSLFY